MEKYSGGATWWWKKLENFARFHTIYERDRHPDEWTVSTLYGICCATHSVARQNMSVYWFYRLYVFSFCLVFAHYLHVVRLVVSTGSKPSIIELWNNAHKVTSLWLRKNTVQEHDHNADNRIRFHWHCMRSLKHTTRTPASEFILIIQTISSQEQSQLLLLYIIKPPLATARAA